MPKEPTALSRFVDAANEPDPVARARALEAIWAPDATLAIDGDVVARDADDLDTFIARWQDDPRAYLWLRRDQRDGAREWGEWKVEGVDVQRDVYALRATLDDDRRLTTVRATRITDRLERPLRERLADVGVSGLAGALTILGGALYFALYLPLSLFYRDLGVAPSEIGYGPQVLIPQSLTLIVLFVLLVGLWDLARRPALATANLLEGARRLADAGDHRTAKRVRAVVYSAGIAIGVVASAALATTAPDGVTSVVSALMLMLRSAAESTALVLVGVFLLWPMSVALRRRLPALDAQMRPREQRYVRAGTALTRVSWLLSVAGTYGLVLLITLPIWALGDADAIRRGGEVGGRLTPWRADPVTLRWHSAHPVALTNDCKTLRLLGVGSGQIVLFDTRLDKLFRVPVADASASVDRDCA